MSLENKSFETKKYMYKNKQFSLKQRGENICSTLSCFIDTMRECREMVTESEN